MLPYLFVLLAIAVRFFPFLGHIGDVGVVRSHTVAGNDSSQKIWVLACAGSGGREFGLVLRGQQFRSVGGMAADVPQDCCRIDRLLPSGHSLLPWDGAWRPVLLVGDVWSSRASSGAVRTYAQCWWQQRRGVAESAD